MNASVISAFSLLFVCACNSEVRPKSAQETREQKGDRLLLESIKEADTAVTTNVSLNVRNIKGDVSIRTNSHEQSVGHSGFEVSADGFISTGPGSAAEIWHGSELLLVLGERTEVVIGECNSSGSASKYEVHLKSGKVAAINRITTTSSVREGIRIETDSLRAIAVHLNGGAVMGGNPSAIAVNADGTVICFNGTLMFHGLGEPKIIGQGETATFNSGTPSRPEKISVGLEEFLLKLTNSALGSARVPP